MPDINILVEMGFPKERVEYALKVTNNKGVEPAMEWLLAHSDDDIPATESSSNESLGVTTATATTTTNCVDVGGEGAATTAGTTINVTRANPATSLATSSGIVGDDAKSLKCDTCNRVFKDAGEAEYHAVKTLHANFSESNEEKAPLTEEEKKAQLVLIEEKLKQKRLEREEREKVEALEREKNRIKSGKDMTEARRVMEEMEMKKIVEQRKRDKAEEKAARERVKAQIEADKAARKAREQGLDPHLDAPLISAASPPSSSSGNKAVSKEYTETRIQIRLQDGNSLQETFSVKEQLSAVRLFIQMKTNAEYPFRLMTNFPRKIFTDEDYDKPLEILGLVPSAVIIMTK